MEHEGWDRVLAAAAEHPELRERWVQGLADNSAAPAAVLRRIITVQDRLTYPQAWLTWINVGAQTLSELAADPDVDVRRAVAAARSGRPARR